MVDPAAAALVALVIFHTGVQILRDTSADLMNSLPREPILGRIRQLLQDVPGVDKVEAIHAHRISLYLLVHVTIGIDGGSRVSSSVGMPAALGPPAARIPVAGTT